MADVTIKTNNQFRFLIMGHELTEAQRKEFDHYESDELDQAYFFQYKGWVYDLADFTRSGKDPMFEGWDAYQSTSAFDGVLIKMSGCSEKVKVGRYYS